MQILLIALFSKSVFGDVRQDPKGQGRMPSTFGYEKLIKQKINDNDQFWRSNIDNEANKRNAGKEPPIDMTPFRQCAKGDVSTYERGKPIPITLRWNNPHGKLNNLI